jgi:hypothetical protein
MPTSNLCEECGAELRACGPAGVCTRCLFHLGLGWTGNEASLASDVAKPEIRMGTSDPEGDDQREIPGTPRRLGDYEVLEEIGREGWVSCIGRGS